MRFLGTTWEKIEGRFLLSTSGSNVSGATGGSNTVTISKANLPAVKVQVDSFSLTTAKHTHPIGPNNRRDNAGTNLSPQYGDWRTTVAGSYWITQSGGGANTGTASPYTSALGSGTALDITPAYYTVHIWKRLT